VPDGPVAIDVPRTQLMFAVLGAVLLAALFVVLISGGQD
jgi:hypothetical protein